MPLARGIMIMDRYVPAIPTTVSISGVQSTLGCSDPSFSIVVIVTASEEANPSIGQVTVFATQGSDTVIFPGFPVTPVDGYVTATIMTSDFSDLGNWNIQAIYADSTNTYAGSYSQQYPIDITLIQTTTSVSSVSPSVLCVTSPVTVLVGVTAADSSIVSDGYVILYAYSNGTLLTIGTGIPIDGAVSIVVPASSFTAVGEWYIQAQYSGAAPRYSLSYSPGGSGGTQVVIYNSTDNISSMSWTTPASVFVNNAISVEVSVSSLYGSPDGRVVSFYGGYVSGSLTFIVSATVVGGAASASIPSYYVLSTGTFYLQASYSDSSCIGSSLSNTSVQVIQSGTTTNITSAIPSTINCTATSIPVTVSITSSPLSPPSIGTVTLYATVGSTQITLGTATPNNGIANIPPISFADFTSFGLWSIQAVYTAISPYTSSSSAAIIMQVIQDPTTTSITAFSVSPLCQSSSFTVTVQVAPTSLSAPSTGTITLTATNSGNTITLGTGMPSSGILNIAVPANTFTSAGVWGVHASYTDGSCYASSTTTYTYPITVYNYTNNTTTISLIEPTSGTSFTIGSSIAVEADISSLYGTVSGTVYFYGGYNANSPSQLASATVSGNAASATIPASSLNSLGEFYLQAVYNGSTCFASSHTPGGTSALPVYIIQGSTTTIITSTIPSSITCSTTIIPVVVSVSSSLLADPSVGTITLNATQGNDVITLGTATPTDGIATVDFIVADLINNGQWEIQAAYTGNIDYSNSSSASYPIQINGDVTTTTIASINGVSSSTTYVCMNSVIPVVVNISPTNLRPPSGGTVAIYGTNSGNTIFLASSSPTNGTVTIDIPSGTFSTDGTWFLEATYAPNGPCYYASNSPNGTNGKVVEVYDYTTNTTIITWVSPAQSSNFVIGSSITAEVSISSVYGSLNGGVIYFYGGYNPGSLSQLTSAAISGNTATVTIPASSLTSFGPFYLQAVYDGSSCFGPSNTPSGTSALSVIIIQSQTTTSITSGIPTSVTCSTASIPAVISVSSIAPQPNPSTGTITLSAIQGSTVITQGTVTPSYGIGTIDITVSSITDNGQWYIQATYIASNDDYTNSVSPLYPFQVNADPTTTTITSIGSYACQNSTNTVVVNVAPTSLSAPSSGTVYLYGTNSIAGSILLATGTPSSGTASIVIPSGAFTESGVWFIEAAYTDGICYGSSNSPVGTNGKPVEVYNNTTNTTYISLSFVSPVAMANSLSVTASVSSTYGAVSGTVSFYGGYDTPAFIGDSTINFNGHAYDATYTIPGSYFTEDGPFYLEAIYSGSPCFASSTTGFGTGGPVVEVVP